jgi:hypothetical protein
MSATLPAGDLGRRIRAAREARGATIADIAATTKISSRALAAIEREAFDQLPAGVFRRGWVRAYADAVGLDGASLARAYVERFEPPPPIEPPAPPRWSWSPPLLLGGVVAIGGVLLAAGAVLSRHDGDEVPVAPGEAGPVAVTTARALDAPPPDGRPVGERGPERRVRLRLELARSSWITAVADGKRVLHRLAGRGEVLLIDAGTSISLRAGDAGAVSCSIDGGPPEVLGASGQPITVYFTAGAGTVAPLRPPATETI